MADTLDDRQPPSAACGVVHLGLGGFHRAHQAMVFATLLRGGDSRWGVYGVAMHNPATARALQAQGQRYHVRVADAAGSQWVAVESIRDCAVLATERARVVAAMAAPATRWITLTITEKGYGADIATLLAEALQTRWRNGLAGLTVASCDNLTGNGSQLRALVRAQALRGPPGLADWIDTRCRFPESMVDRIVPSSTPEICADALKATGEVDTIALATESFWQWVLQRDLADPSDAEVLAAAGVTLVDDVRPFETAKLRMLNGTHTALAAMGPVLGLPLISDCMAQPALRDFAHGLMTHEVAPHLERPGLDAYRDALLARFANETLQHRCLQICSDNSQKIPLRWQGSLLALRAVGAVPRYLAVAAAAWMRFLQGCDATGSQYEWSDPLRGELQATALRTRDDGPAAVSALMGDVRIWGPGLAADRVWHDAVLQAWVRIRLGGLLSVVEMTRLRG